MDAAPTTRDPEDTVSEVMVSALAVNVKELLKSTGYMFKESYSVVMRKPFVVAVD
jgi:hypothetical protein